MPPVPWDKSRVIAEWWSGHPRGAALFYFGDSGNDEPALALVRSLGGAAVTVGRTASRAEYALPEPADVTWFLEWLAREWAHARRSPG
jgi:hypothetical protein